VNATRPQLSVNATTTILTVLALNEQKKQSIHRFGRLAMAA
jgi:hypothetical protein